MYVKICGLTSIASARTALDAGADAIGMVLSERSRRNVSAETVAQIAAFVGSSADIVVVVDRMPAERAAALVNDAGASVLQLHGAYSDADVARARAVTPRVWRAMPWADHDGSPVGAHGEEAVLLDSPVAGSGESWDPTALGHRTPSGRWILAGGLSPDTVIAAVRGARPWGVDVSSGVESAPGVKSDDLIRRFVTAAREA